MYGGVWEYDESAHIGQWSWGGGPVLVVSQGRNAFYLLFFFWKMSSTTYFVVPNMIN